MNDYLRAGHPGEGNWNANYPGVNSGLASSSCADASSVILLYEQVQESRGLVQYNGSPFFIPSRPTIVVSPAFASLRYPHLPQSFHAGRSSFLFVDGHVKALLPWTTWTQACRDGVQDNVTNFAGYSVRPQVIQVYPDCGTVVLWNPRSPGVLFP